MNAWFAEHELISYILIFVLVTFVYNKVFRQSRLPILKEVVVVFLLLIGSYMLLFFQVAAGLPIIPSLLVAVFLMFLTKVRYIVEDKQKKSQSGDNN
ncbi:YlaH-like family protein [Paenibacillus turpanensis]|uniref:YlaH-like family protein n=1 Tax=Paenibacillus turpanensis TaxID=2689078 RepID=UPI00140A9D26|nr:YlaH-like family protein [Paenibacillus turpanensis]